MLWKHRRGEPCCSDSDRKTTFSSKAKHWNLSCLRGTTRVLSGQQHITLYGLPQPEPRSPPRLELLRLHQPNQTRLNLTDSSEMASTIFLLTCHNFLLQLLWIPGSENASSRRLTEHSGFKAQKKPRQPENKCGGPMSVKAWSLEYSTIHGNRDSEFINLYWAAACSSSGTSSCDIVTWWIISNHVLDVHEHGLLEPGRTCCVLYVAGKSIFSGAHWCVLNFFFPFLTWS